MRWWFLAMLFGLAYPAPARTDEPLAADLIHADLPLFGSETENKWPQAFTADDGGFGCTSRVKFGIWKLSPAGRDDDDQWYGVRNYGVFHCWANVASSSEKAALGHVNVQPAFFVLLEISGTSELWALQLGARPGSDYVLLRRSVDKAIIGRFDVLQRDCSKTFRRKRPPLDILSTDYCAINTPQDLKSFARQMAKRPPLGHLVWVEDEKDGG